MKLRTYLTAGVIAMALVMGSSLCVYANPSVTAVPSTGKKDQYEVSNIKDMLGYDEIAEKHPVVIGAIEEVNSSKEKSTQKFVDTILKDADEKTKASVEKIKDILENSEFISNFFDIHVKDNELASSDYIRKNLDVEKSKDGKFRVTLHIPTLTKNNKKVYVLHYSKDNNEWEVLWPKEIDYEKKTITIEFKDFSPAAVLAAFAVDEDSTGTVETPTDEEDDSDKTKTARSHDDDDDDDDDDDSSSSSSSSSAKSPKTGVADTWMLWFAASALLAGAARKRH
jgi:hypothetical protein